MKQSFYFVIDNDVVIATPDLLRQGGNTQDVCAEDLAQSHELLEKLKWPLIQMIRPLVHYAEPTPPEKRRSLLAAFLSDMGNNSPVVAKRKHDYIMTNGMIRILWLKP
jgi:hypothetical protein